MKPAVLDHVGIGVLPGSPLAKLFSVLGLAVAKEESVPHEKVNTQFLPLPLQQGEIELLQSTSEDGVIAKFLAKNGRDGVHHLSFRVENIRAISKSLEEAGFSMIYTEPKAGANSMIVNFIHPKTSGGVLIEISEKVAE